MTIRHFRPVLILAALAAMLIVPNAGAQTSGSAQAGKPEQNAPQHFDSQAGQRDNQNLSQRLERSGGVIRPPDNVDPEMHQAPPPSGDNMPVIPAPGAQGGSSNVKPK